jgi:hypothetical protein
MNLFQQGSIKLSGVEPARPTVGEILYETTPVLPASFTLIFEQAGVLPSSHRSPPPGERRDCRHHGVEARAQIWPDDGASGFVLRSAGFCGYDVCVDAAQLNNMAGFDSAYCTVEAVAASRGHNGSAP